MEMFYTAEMLLVKVRKVNKAEPTGGTRPGKGRKEGKAFGRYFCGGEDRKSLIGGGGEVSETIRLILGYRED